MKFRLTKISLLLMCFVLAQNLVFAFSDAGSAKPADVFSHEDIRVEANQVLHRLMVAGASAVVLGSIQEGIVIVDGNLFIAAEARVQGNILVLGGSIEQQQGAQVQGNLLNIETQSFPILTWIMAGLTLVMIFSLVAIPGMIWIILGLSKRFPFYRRLKNEFIRIQHRWPVLYIVLTLGLSCVLLAVFAELAWQTVFRHTMDLSDSVLIWFVRYFANPRLDQIMIVISSMGYGYIYGLLVAAALSVLALYRRWLEFLGLAICLTGGAFLNYVLKNLFERARPEAFHLVQAWGYSFPSGHAMASLYFYGLLAFFMARNMKSWLGRYVLLAATILFVVAMGVSRVYLGVHYPSDVIAGYTAGAMWLAFNISLLLWWERKGG